MSRKVHISGFTQEKEEWSSMWRKTTKFPSNITSGKQILRRQQISLPKTIQRSRKITQNCPLGLADQKFLIRRFNGEVGSEAKVQEFEV